MIIISNTTVSMMMYYLPSSMSSLWAGWEAAGAGVNVFDFYILIDNCSYSELNLGFTNVLYCFQRC